MLLELEGAPRTSPKEAFEALLAAQAPPLTAELAAIVSEARELKPLLQVQPRQALLDLIDLSSTDAGASRTTGMRASFR